MSLTFGQCFSKVFCLFIKNFVPMRVGLSTSDVVLFSIVAFKTVNISQGSIATYLRCGGIFSDNIITHFRLILTVKILKNRLVFGKVKAYKNSANFWDTLCVGITVIFRILQKL